MGAKNPVRRKLTAREAAEKYREIAEEMGISTGAVGRILHDARKIEMKEAPVRDVG